MNMWGLSPAFVDELEDDLPLFLNAEYHLPKIVDQLIHTGKTKVKVIETYDNGLMLPIKKISQRNLNR